MSPHKSGGDIILVVVPKLLTLQVFFPGKALSGGDIKIDIKEKVFSDLRHVSGILRVFRFPPIAESGVKQHNPNQDIPFSMTLFPSFLFVLTFSDGNSSNSTSSSTLPMLISCND